MNGKDWIWWYYENSFFHLVEVSPHASPLEIAQRVCFFCFLFFVFFFVFLFPFHTKTKHPFSQLSPPPSPHPLFSPLPPPPPLLSLSQVSLKVKNCMISPTSCKNRLTPVNFPFENQFNFRDISFPPTSPNLFPTDHVFPFTEKLTKFRTMSEKIWEGPPLMFKFMIRPHKSFVLGKIGCYSYVVE